MDLNKKTDKELREIAKSVEALNFKSKYLKFYDTFPDTGDFRRELYKPHCQFMAAGKDKRFRVFAGGNRCLAYDTTTVCMADGTKKPLKNVRVGDFVLCYDIKTKQAKPTVVLNTYNNGIKKCFRIHFADGSFVDATENHLFPRQRRSGRYIDCHGKKKKQLILKKRLDELKIGQRLLSPEEVIYSKKELPLDPYLLGALLGDGGLTTKGKTFTNADLVVIDRVNSLWELKKHTSNKYGYTLVQTKDNTLNQVLENFNLNVRGDFKYIPKIYLTSSIEQRLQLLAGLIDTDGSFGDFTNKSEQLVKDFCQLVRSLGGKASYKQVQKTCTNNGVIGTYYRSYWRLNKEIPLCLKYKQRITKRAVDYTQRIITKIEPLGLKETGCLEVNHQDHCFLINDFVAVGNSGKSFTLAYELTAHALLDYPDWWEGKKFKNISTIWIIAESGALFRDSLQKTLLGDPGEDIGTGMIPLAEKNNGVGIIETKAMQSIGGAIGTILVKNKKGKHVSIIIKTNEMQREQFQAAKVDIVAFDEEPKPDIYTECMMRLMGMGKKEPGIAMFAFTPLKGLSEVVLKFLPNGEFPERGSPIDEPDKYICRVEWQDVPHLSKADKDTMLKEIPPNEREARTKGIPGLGSGRIYPVEEDFIVCSPFEIPDHWGRAFGLDFASPNGYTAAVWLAEDPSTKVRYIYAEYKRSKQIDEMHIEAIKAKGAWIRGGCDPASGTRDNGQMRSDFYRSKGLDLTTGENAIIGGISSILSQFELGTLKVFNHCLEFLKEYRLYRYDAKDPNKPARDQQDHLLDALRYVDSVFDWIAVSKLSSNPEYYSQKPRRVTKAGDTGY